MKNTKAPRQGQKQQHRNGHAFHPIMSKGGAHQKSTKAIRQAARQLTQRQLREGPDRPDHSTPINSTAFNATCIKLAAIKKAA